MDVGQVAAEIPVGRVDVRKVGMVLGMAEFRGGRGGGSGSGVGGG